MFLKDLTAHYRQKIENRFPEKLSMSLLQKKKKKKRKEKKSRHKGFIYLFINIVERKKFFFK